MASREPQTAAGSVSSGDTAEVVETCNRFGLDLDARLAGQPGNHPFLFLIHDRATRLIHFLGRFAGPG